MAFIKKDMKRPSEKVKNMKKDNIQEETVETKKERSTLHDDLVEAGRKWLLNNSPVKGNIECSKCQIVITEMFCYTSNGEMPDCLGFSGSDRTVLLEAKTSRADFFKDSKKRFRADGVKSMGNYKLFITPKGLIKLDELPVNWGLIEVNSNGQARKIKDAKCVESNKYDERAILISSIKRIASNATEGVSCRFFPLKNSKNKATVTA